MSALTPSLKLIVLSLGLATALSACGTKGALEPPPSSVEAAPAKAKTDDGIGAIPTLGQKKPEVKPVKTPNQPFLFDFLL